MEILLLFGILLFVGFLFCYMICMPGKSFKGVFQSMSPFEKKLEEELRQHVTAMANIGSRHFQKPESLHKAAHYIKNTLETYGYHPTTQAIQMDGRVCENVIAEIPGNGQTDEIIIIGAHYDSAMPNCVGANDNGSGVAAVLALAHVFANKPSKRTLRFVFFANEEPPYYRTSNMGSLLYAKTLKRNKEKVKLMISLEAIGYYTDEPYSQHFSFPFNLFYPREGNFLAFISNLSSRSYLRRAIKTFRTTTAFPAYGGAVPSFVKGVSWSDHWSFWKMGYPAIMLTDTAFARYPYYHTSEDTPDKIQFAKFARVVGGLEKIVIDFCSES